MLILNNGAQKSGSSLIQSIVTKLLKPAYPSALWRNGWQNPSVDRDRLEDYIAADEWRDAPYTLIKSHFSYSPKFKFLLAPDIRIIVSQRNIPDSVLSWFHHNVRLHGLDPQEKERWLKSEGVTFARHLLNYHRSWQNVPGILFINYESLAQSGIAEIITIGSFLDVKIDPDQAKSLAASSFVRRQFGEAPRDGAHVRSGGESRAAKEMSAETYALFAEMDRDLNL